MHVRSPVLGCQHEPCQLTQHQDFLDVQDYWAQFVQTSLLGGGGGGGVV